MKVAALIGLLVKEVDDPLLLGGKAPHRAGVVVAAVQPVRMHRPAALA